MFKEITDPAKAMELYRAGLLWSARGQDHHTIASGWFEEDECSGIYANLERNRRSPRHDVYWRFYMLLEE